MADGPGLRVIGAKEIRAGLKLIQDPSVTNELKAIHFQVADMLVAQATRNAARLGRHSFGSAVARKQRQHKFGGIPAPVIAASTLRAGRRLASATVTLGDDRVPFALGHEFGGHQDKTRARKSGSYVGYRQFPVPNKKGYFLYPALAQTRDEIGTVYLKAVEELTKKAFG